MTINNQLNTPEPFSLASGGTNASLTASNGGIIYSTSSALAILSTSANGMLVTDSSGIPSISSVFTPTFANDTNGNHILQFSSASNAVNYFQITNRQTGSSPILQVAGSDSSISINLSSKNGNISLLDGTNTIAPALQFYNAAGTHLTALKAANTQATSVTFTLPAADGSSGQFIKTDGSGNLSFSSASSITDPLTTLGDLWGYSTTDARVPAGSAQQILYTSPGNVATSPTSLAYDYIRPTPIYSFSVFSDFCNLPNTAENVPSPFNSGTGASVSQDDIFFTNGTAIGVIGASTGTTTTGTSGINLCSGADIFFSGGQIIFETVIQIPTLSNGTDTFGVQCGLNGAGSGSGHFSPSSGVYFYYSSTINSGQFQCISSSSGTATLNTSFTVVAATWYRLKFIINSAANLITFYINDVSQGTLNSNIPSTAGCVSYVQILKSAGTTSRTCYVDYLWYSKDFSTAR